MMIKTYYEHLIESLKEYDGLYSEVLKDLPSIFKILQKIYVDKEISWEQKLKINSCFSYLAIPNDLYPDNLGPQGYMDDYFVTYYVFRSIYEENSALVNKYWCIDKTSELFFKELDEVLPQILNQFTSRFGFDQNKLLNFTGISRIEYMSNEFKFMKQPENIEEKVERIQDETIELMSILKTALIARNIKTVGLRKLRDYKKIYPSADWDLVMNIMNGIKIHQTKFDNTHELNLEKIKQEVQQEVEQKMLDDI